MLFWDSLLDEVMDRRERMSRDGYRGCTTAACNCGSWHKAPGRNERELMQLVEYALGPNYADDDDDGDDDDDDKDKDESVPVTERPAWRKRARAVLRRC